MVAMYVVSPKDAINACVETGEKESEIKSKEALREAVTEFKVIAYDPKADATIIKYIF